MENNEEQEVEKMVITEDIRSFIYDTTKWTRFLSIVGFVLTGLIVISAFSIGSIINAGGMPPEGLAAFQKMGGSVFTVFMFLYALLIFYPSFLLYKYSSMAKKAVLYGDQAALSTATYNMRGYFKFWGILCIAVIALNIIGFLTTLFNIS